MEWNKGQARSTDAGGGSPKRRVIYVRRNRQKIKRRAEFEEGPSNVDNGCRRTNNYTNTHTKKEVFPITNISKHKLQITLTGESYNGNYNKSYKSRIQVTRGIKVSGPKMPRLNMTSRN